MTQAHYLQVSDSKYLHNSFIHSLKLLEEASSVEEYVHAFILLADSFSHGLTQTAASV